MKKKITILALSIVLTSAAVLPAQPPAASGTTLVDVSGRLGGYTPDTLPVPLGGEGIAGIGWFDYERDGDLDLFVPNGIGAPNALYRNNGDGTFTDVAALAGVASTSGYSTVSIGDLDNDGDDDILLSGEGFFLFLGASPVSLYRNNGDGTFTDVAQASGVVGAESALASVMADFDNDGDLEIFISAPGHIGLGMNFGIPGIAPSEAHRNVLYRNDGEFQFTEIAAAAGVDSDEAACAAAATDYDGDEYIDLIVANCNAFTGNDPRPTPFHLYRNNGDLTFTDLAVDAGLDKLGFWMSVSPGDYDNDGDIDFFATDTGIQDQIFLHALFRNNGDGTYTDVAPELGLAEWEFGWGATFFDADNDGFLDLFIVGGFTTFGVLGSPGRLFMNDGDGTFTQASLDDSGGDLSSEFTSGLAQGDFDGDGNQDLAVNTRSALVFDPVSGQIVTLTLGNPVLLRNPGNGNNAIRLRLAATSGHPDAIGARVEVKTAQLRQVREIYAGSSNGCAESPWLHFGIGGRDSADVKVFWPSGRVEEFDDVAAGSLVTLVEGQGRSDG